MNERDDPMAGRRKKKTKLVEIQYSIGLMLFCGLLILIVTLPDILREYEYRTASDTLRSWEYEYSPRRKYTNSKVWFEVNIGGRIHRIGAVTYMPLKQGTPYYADEFEEILNATSAIPSITPIAATATAPSFIWKLTARLSSIRKSFFRNTKTAPDSL